jgi:hypothetical protein
MHLFENWAKSECHDIIALLPAEIDKYKILIRFVELSLI